MKFFACPKCFEDGDVRRPITPWFRVTLRQWHHMRDGSTYNPFRARDIWRKRPCTHRIWEFQAKNEAEVRRLYQEAKDAKLPEIHGFDLLSIEAIDVPSTKRVKP
jgi:hypothetical protein